MKNIPKLLVFVRLLLGFVILALSIYPIYNHKIIMIVLLTVGLLTDVFDGIIARKLKVSNTNLRRLDSTVDQIFFICVAIASYIVCPYFYKDNFLMLSILIGFEACTYVVSFIKFKKEVATHSLGAKFWTLILFATLIQIIYSCESGIIFQLCFWVGLITRLEIIGIILVLKQWTNDVPSLYYALRLRRGLPIKRNKLFNG